MLKSLNGRQNDLILNYNQGKMLQGFRESKILEKYATTTIINENEWQYNPYMNTEKNISSPSEKILGRYFIDILYTLFNLHAHDPITKIVITIGTGLKTDYVTNKILDAFCKSTKIPIQYIEVEAKRKEKISADLMRISIKRGFYDDFEMDNTDLNYIYTWFSKSFYHRNKDLNSIVARYSSIEDKYLKWLFVKAIINEAIRKEKYDLADVFIKKLKSNNTSIFDYINSESFLILKKDGLKKATLYLNNNLDIDQFLMKNEINFGESLVMKNYASMLDEGNKLKKKILEKCLEHTPQDVDLWKFYFNEFPNHINQQKKYINMLENGYIDMSIVKNVDFNQLNENVISKVIILCKMTHNNLGEDMIPYISDKSMREILINFWDCVTDKGGIVF